MISRNNSRLYLPCHVRDHRGVIFVETMFPHSRPQPVLNAILFVLYLRCHTHQHSKFTKLLKTSQIIKTIYIFRIFSIKKKCSFRMRKTNVCKNSIFGHIIFGTFEIIVFGILESYRIFAVEN